MNYFIELLESEKHFSYVMSSYLITFFIIVLLAVSSKIEYKKLKKKYQGMVKEDEK